MTSHPRPSRAPARPLHVRVADGPAAAPGRSHNVPSVPSSFVGRQREVADVTALLGAARLVTLTGPGGMGKTRLAIEVASGLTPAFREACGSSSWRP